MNTTNKRQIVSAWSGKIPDSWQWYTLNDLISYTVDNRGKTPPTIEGGIPLIATYNIDNNHLYPTSGKLRFVSKKIYETWFRSHPQPDDIIITNKGEYRGTVCLVPNPANFCIAQDMIALRVHRNLVNPHYLLAILRSAFFKSQVDAYTVSSAIPHLRKTDFDQLVIPIPPLSEQDSIGNIYFTLSQKIELNHVMNETLEATARAIFRSWFVDFDPVYAKSRGEQPFGMDADTAALFPDSFEPSALGDIPSGWRVGMLGEVIEIYDSKRIPLSAKEREKRQGQYPYYGATSIMDYVDDYLFDGIYLLMGEDGSVTDTLGYPVLQYVWGKFWVNNHAHVLLGKKPFSTEQLYLALRNTYILPYVTGAVQAKLNQGNMSSIPFLIAPDDVNSSFYNLIEMFFATIRSNNEQVKTLSELRDILLPKLISGEIRVGEAEEIINDSLE